jgi:hypothetical protein
MPSGYNNLWDSLNRKAEKNESQPIPEIDSPFSLNKDNIYFGERMCGYVVGRTYFSERIPSKHYYVMGQGYPITNDIIKKLKDKNVFHIVIIEQTKKGIRYWASTLEKYIKAVLIQHEPFEQQKCVPLSEMKDITHEVAISGK